MNFKITTAVLIGAEKQQQEDKVVTMHELSCSSLQVIYGLISFLVLFTIQSEYYPPMFAGFASVQGIFSWKIFMYTFLPKSLCWQYTISPGKAYKILRAIPAS